MNDHKTRLRALLVSSLALSMIATPTAFAADTEPFASFRPGAPGEPMWNMLKLDITKPNSQLQLEIRADNFRCPFAWGLVLFRGEAPRAAPEVSITVNFGYGYQGVEVYDQDDSTVRVSNVEHDGAERCDTGARTLGIGFEELPVGVVYLLQYKAGTPFMGEAKLLAPQGGVRILDESSGDSTFYLGDEEFGQGSLRIAAYSPGACTGGAINPNDGSCGANSRAAGGVFGSAEASEGRTAQATFERRPYFWFGTLSNQDVSNATVVTPRGLTIPVRAALVSASAGDMSVNPGGARYATRGPATAHDAGQYTFNIGQNVDVDPTGTTAWRAFGADYWFPEEA